MADVLSSYAKLCRQSMRHRQLSYWSVAIDSNSASSSHLLWQRR